VQVTAAHHEPAAQRTRRRTCRPGLTAGGSGAPQSITRSTRSEVGSR
jgi:hypothetical protein